LYVKITSWFLSAYSIHVSNPEELGRWYSHKDSFSQNTLPLQNICALRPVSDGTMMALFAVAIIVMTLLEYSATLQDGMAADRKRHADF
jgi:hypothetical protein